MGDRGNIVVKQSDGQVWFYTHWSGSEIKETVKTALARKQRWQDESYLARIIWDALVPQDSHGEETGFGISTSMTDNEHDIVVVDCHAQRVFLIQASDLDANRRVPEDYAPAPKQSWTFNEFIT